jgi:hypothetical protein
MRYDWHGRPGESIKRYFEPETGKWYADHRKSGKRLKSEFGTSAFFAELEAINAESQGIEAKAGTLGALIVSYRGSAGFKSLKSRTKSDDEKVLEYLRPLAPSPLAELTQGWIARLRDKTFENAKRNFANYVLTVLSILFEHGIEQELMSANPVSRVKRVRKATDATEANRPWMDYEAFGTPSRRSCVKWARTTRRSPTYSGRKPRLGRSTIPAALTSQRRWLRRSASLRLKWTDGKRKTSRKRKSGV